MKKAFSLVELSIVLIIIGLLVGGVTTGSKLIESSKLNKLVNEISSIKITYHTFKSIYEMAPGDLDIAQSYFGTTGIVNGDGDGKIEYSSETLNVPAQLEKAELLEYRTDGGYLNLESFDSRVWIIHSLGHAGYFNFPSNNLLQIGAYGLINDAFLTPIQAYKVDTKLDDGISKSGKLSYKAHGTVTHTTCSGGGDNYDLTSDEIGCNIVYDID